MAARLTDADHRICALALHLAIQWEHSLLDALGSNPGSDRTAACAVQCRNNIKAFTQLLDKLLGE